MKKYVIALVAAILMVIGAAVVSAPSASAATVGNKVCVETYSATGAWVIGFYNSTDRVNIYPGRCASPLQGFAVPQGWYCRSQWGYVYDGSWFQKYYGFTSNYNTLRLDCRHA